MDRRQRKTRNAIFQAFITLLSKHNVHQITVGQIIQQADVGRATFYAHFETKESLLKALCGELFDHLFAENDNGIFACDPPDSVFLHLLQHLQKNDNNILRLLSGRNNELFWAYFQDNLNTLVLREWEWLSQRKAPELPEEFWKAHICGVFTQTVKWWIQNGLRQTPEEITKYFQLAI